MKRCAILLLSMAAVSSCGSQGPEGGAPFTIVTHNVGNIDHDPAPARELAQTYREFGNVDAFLLQELPNRRYAEALAAALNAQSDQNYHLDYSFRLRIAVVSRWPVTTAATMNMPEPQSLFGALRVLVETEAGPLELVSVHLDPILKLRNREGFVRVGFAALGLLRELFFQNARSRSVNQLTEWMQRPLSTPTPTVIGGDFNTVPGTIAITRMTRRYRDALAGSGNFFSGTYWKIALPIKPRVDFLFHSGELDTRSAKVADIRTGDHFPVVATFERTAPP